MQASLLRQDPAPLLEKRRGDCNRCGACCKILFRCPFLGEDADGQYTCRIYDKRFAQCRLYPLHAADLAARLTNPIDNTTTIVFQLNCADMIFSSQTRCKADAASLWAYRAD